jgi:hypothetical protein
VPGGGSVHWDDTGEDAAERKRLFVRRVLEGVRSGDRIARAEAVGAVVYLVLGRWTETVKAAGVLGRDVLEGKARSAATEVQLEAMKEGVRVVAECGGIEVVWEVLRAGFEMFWWVSPVSLCGWGGADFGRSDELPQNVQMAAEELIHLMTVMYMAIQEALDDPEGMADVRQRLREWNQLFEWMAAANMNSGPQPRPTELPAPGHHQAALG